ncbi:hypothetical protein [Alkaliphilus transvaalensis]|uniref:hypothetical protein n=1 Tax=Alkaliphilus transvaalensis TaxID=114628 RepID=UPI00047AF8DA|nr:hypothetical protein [Alkaliphilus transvaalensis]
MAQIIDIKEYKDNKMLKQLENTTDRTIKQREFFINLYQFLNKNLNNEFDEILIEFDDLFLDLVKKYKINPLVVNYFHIPMITFMVMVFIKNSDLNEHFPELSTIENNENKDMFKDTLLKIIETYTDDDSISLNPIALEKDLDKIINRFYVSLLTIIPHKIVLV